MSDAMRPILVLILTSLAASSASGAARPPLDLPVRERDAAGGARAPAPAYAGDVLELRLTREASRAVWPMRRGAGRMTRLGLPGLDRAASDLGGVWFEPEFPGEKAPTGSAETDFASFYIAHLPRGVDLEDALARFADLSEVVSAEPIAIMPVSLVPNDSLWSVSWWFDQLSDRDIDAPEAWNVTLGDTSIVVGILDTGVLPYHPDLGGTVAGLPGQMWTNWVEAAGAPGVDDDGNGYVDDVRGWDFVNLSSGGSVVAGEDWQDEDNDPNDFDGHGTAMAGVVGALTNNAIGVAGMAWKVRIMPLRIGWGEPSGGVVRMDFVARAIRYATLTGAHILNASFASRDESGLAAAVDAATAAGVILVTAAGNLDSRGIPQPNDLALRPDVISVASTGEGDVLSVFSNRGPQVDLAAPGEGIWTTYVRRFAGDSVSLRQPGYLRASGTSLSAPLVTGTAALVQARRLAMGLSLNGPQAMLQRLTETADDIDAQNPGLVGLYGSGRLNAYRAVAGVGGALGSREGVALAPGTNPSRLPVSFYWQRAPEAEVSGQSIRIYDLAGRLVRVLDVGAGPGGVAPWDGRDRDGTRVGAGLYLASLESGQRRARTRLVLIP